MDTGLDIQDFRRWALGELRENRNRGVFAEWLVGQALGAIDDKGVRLEWMPWDLEYRDQKIEVKASGQAWSPRPNPRFDIACRQLDPPARVADVYVFCLHTPERATNENVIDPNSWQFWVVPTRWLDSELGQQKSVGPATLDGLAARVSWPSLAATVDRCIQQVAE